MDIALGYAFVLAIAGGLIAICFSWLGELMQDRSAEASRREAFPAPRQAAGWRHPGARRADGMHRRL